MEKLSPFAKAMREMAPWLDAVGRVTGGLGLGALLGWVLTGCLGLGSWAWGLGLGLGALGGLVGFVIAATKLSKPRNNENKESPP
ncbi:MAG: hypothetical protein FWD46_09155 [Cystobacterineae bacterium]|nr:hypothetical protein [Cystobacterineae bacterium]